MSVIRVMDLGNFVNMDASAWQEVKLILQRGGHKVVVDHPSYTGASIKRVHRTKSGPKPKPK